MAIKQNLVTELVIPAVLIIVFLCSLFYFDHIFNSVYAAIALSLAVFALVGAGLYIIAEHFYGEHK